MAQNKIMREVLYQECLYKEMTGEDISLGQLKDKCGFNCSEETCEYCVEIAKDTEEQKTKVTHYNCDH